MWCARVRPLTSTYSRGYTTLCCMQHTVQTMQSTDDIAGRSTPKRKLSYLLHTSSYFPYRFHISSHVVTPGKVQFSLGLNTQCHGRTSRSSSLLSLELSWLPMSLPSMEKDGQCSPAAAPHLSEDWCMRDMEWVGKVVCI